MENKKCTFEKLTTEAAAVLKGKRKRADGTIHHYHVLWRKIKRFMDTEKISYFDSAVGKAFLLKEFGNQDYSKLSKREKDLIRGVGVLSEFHETGTIQFVKEQCVFDGSVGKQMTSYISHKIAARLKSHTIAEHEQHLFRFLCFLNKIGITSIEAINLGHILNFLRGMNCSFSTLTHLTIRTLRGFFNHLYNEHLITANIAAQIPRDNYKRQAKLPSTYSEEEIEKMIATIDRSNATGKRNYAIVLLAARLGLRASDIANLKFENLLWEKCSIVLHQYKTGRKLELPILSDIGDAIIDYLKYGRPKSNEAFVFLLARAPFSRIHGTAITGIVKSSFVEAGIQIENRKHGPHALRHSLAGILLEKSTVLPVISEVLGHENTESTKFYLRIDLKSMRQCALDVPLVSPSFYDQKGDTFMRKRMSGIYASYIEQFIAFKRQLGFKYQTEETIFFLFDRFTVAQGETRVGITRELATAWIKQNPNESDSYRYHRTGCLNQLASFLDSFGIFSYIIQMPPCKSTFTPYIYSTIEISAIFKACDELIAKKKVLSSILIILPALLRLLYGTGLRIGEALALQNKDVSLDDNYLVIRDSKNGKDRMIPISNSLSMVFKEYVRCRDLMPLIKTKSTYFFVSLMGKECKQDTVHEWFQEILRKAGIPRRDSGPRLHDLRHTFSVHSLAMMAEAGIDLYCTLPILSTYLGHQSLEATNAYVRLTSEMYPGLLKDVDLVCLNVFPNSELYEAD